MIVLNVSNKRQRDVSSRMCAPPLQVPQQQQGRDPQGKIGAAYDAHGVDMPNGRVTKTSALAEL
jgi:hypothetical protein